ncbi:hypothetical protein ACLI09_10760 [Flavobacterium sp. RHBU_24]|uniref:hypothetical protein n=1 Tax=Flavobacterium sp. RHBU_24 TaxID=3391185 RepID=UPI0039856488
MISNNKIFIGFAGKRAVNESDNLIIATGLNNLFSLLNLQFEKTHFQLINGLADGADQLAAETFINTKLNSGNTGSLTSVLAFKKNDFLKTVENTKKFTTLYNYASQVAELDGKYMEGDIGKRFREEAYAQQGKILALFSDILIVATRLDSEVTSKSFDTALYALHKKKPVIFLNLDDSHFYLFKDLASFTIEDKKPCTLKVITDFVKSKFLFKPGDLESNEINRDVFFKLRALLCKRYERMFLQRKIVEPSEHKAVDIDFNKLTQEISAIRSDKRKSSGIYQTQYRGAYLLNFLFALLAVFFAVITMLIYSLKHHISDVLNSWNLPDSSHIPLYIIILVSVIKIALITGIIKNTNRVNKNKYNKKAIEYRYIAERLRVNYYLSFFGILKSPNPELGSHIQNYISQYSGEINYQTLISSLSHNQFKIIIDKTHLLNITRFINSEWLLGQIKYHEEEKKRMSVMHSGLEKIVEFISKSVLVVIAFEITIVTIKITNHDFEHIAGILSPFILGIIILAPAIVTTINSMIFQTEARRIAFRSQLAFDQIKSISDKLQEKIQDIEREPDKGSRVIEILELINTMAEMTTDEVAEWSILYEKPILEQG